MFVICATDALAQHVFLVRHAERADTVNGGQPMMAADPNLSEAGRRRAESLATVLRDARITAIFVTEYKRTQETAAPLAKALGISPTVVTSKDTLGLVARVRESTGNVLVVGHSNSVPNIITALGVVNAPPIADTEYDNLFIVTAPSQLVQLRYR